MIFFSFILNLICINLMSLVTLLPLAGLDLLAEPMVAWQCHASTAASTLIFLLSLTATCLIAADQGT